MNQKNIQSAQFGKQLMKRRLKWIGWVSLVPIAVVVFALCYFGYHEAIAFGELKHKLLEYRQAGEPVDDESMAKFFEGMSNKEGTEAWSEILEVNQAIQNAYNESIKLPIVGLGKLPVQLLPGSDWSDEASVAEYLQEVQPIIARIERASSFPRPVWMPIHFEGFSTLLPQLQESLTRKADQRNYRQLAAFLTNNQKHAGYHLYLASRSTPCP